MIDDAKESGKENARPHVLALSVLFPGLGQLYAGDVRTSMLHLLPVLVLNAVMIYLYFNFAQYGFNDKFIFAHIKNGLNIVMRVISFIHAYRLIIPKNRQVVSFDIGAYYLGGAAAFSVSSLGQWE